MSKQKLTPWFDGGIKPVREGVYQQMSGSRGRVGYQKWDGRRWSEWFESAEEAAGCASAAAESYQNDKWRGLANNPKRQS